LAHASINIKTKKLKYGNFCFMPVLQQCHLRGVFGFQLIRKKSHSPFEARCG
jgi:hypothetical protein